MAIPNYETVMLPFLRTLSDGNIWRVRDVSKHLESEFKLSDQEIAERIPSGQSTVLENRVGWARTYLKKAGLIEPVTRGHYRISSRGVELLKSRPAKIDGAVLRQFPEFLDFVKPKIDGQPSAPEPLESSESQTPLEILESAYPRLSRALADELLQAVRTASPAFFERLVVDVLVAMGYGGSRKDAGEAVGKTGDDGIDGIIKEDKLGLDAFMFKRKDGPRQWPARAPGLCGSLEGHRARKGVFITTSQFSKDAREYVSRIEKRIVLLDGEQLAQYMMDFGVGVTDVGHYSVKKLDQDYFDE